MIIQPKVRGFICTTAHPKGCYKAVEEQVNYVKSKPKIDGPKNVLVIGASTGFGLASRITAAFGAGAKTIGVFFEKPAEGNRTASAGWYNSAAFEQLAHAENLYAKSINGDAFSDAIKQEVMDLIRKDLQKIDLVVYSLASPRRTHPKTGEVFSSVLKPIGQTFTSKTVDPLRGEVKEVTLESANAEEIAQTVSVMGGEDWEMWLDLLAKENLLAEGAITVAYSYIGPELTHPIYKSGSIGKAKEDLQKTAECITQKLQKQKVQALISVNKALVTQASSAIPVVPLYISLLYKLMKQKGTHEGCIEQMERLFSQHLYAKNPVARDAEGRVRVDDWEMAPDIQEKITQLWKQVTSENLSELADVAGYLNDFYRLFGFNFAGVDYAAEVEPEVGIESIE